MAEAETAGEAHKGTESGRRDFLELVAWSTAAVGVAAAIWPLIDSMNPAADTLALAETEVDLSGIDEGMAITVQWQGKPTFVRHRTPAEIEAARAEDVRALPDPEPDEARVVQDPWLVMVGVCTHLGCVPLGQRVGEPKGDYAGWFCPCHGSHYDTSGRIRRGPAPRNLEIPPYEFTDDLMIVIG